MPLTKTQKSTLKLLCYKQLVFDWEATKYRLVKSKKLKLLPTHETIAVPDNGAIVYPSLKNSGKIRIFRGAREKIWKKLIKI